MGVHCPVFGFLGKWGKKKRSEGNLFWGYCDKYSSGYPSIRWKLCQYFYFYFCVFRKLFFLKKNIQHDRWQNNVKYLNIYIYFIILNNGFHYPHVCLAGKLGKEEGSKWNLFENFYNSLLGIQEFGKNLIKISYALMFLYFVFNFNVITNKLMVKSFFFFKF